MSFVSCVFSPFSHMPLKTGAQGGPREEPRSWGVRGRLGSPAASPYTAWMWFLLAMGCRLMIHAFLYYSWHTGMSTPLFLSIPFFSWKQFHKDPLMIHFNHATKISPILSLLFTIFLFFPLHFSHTLKFHMQFIFAISFSFSLLLFLVQVPLETSLWFFKFHHFYFSFFIQASLFIASTWRSLVFSLKPLVSGPLSLSTSSYHVIFLTRPPLPAWKDQRPALPLIFSLLFLISSCSIRNRPPSLCLCQTSSFWVAEFGYYLHKIKTGESVTLLVTTSLLCTWIMSALLAQFLFW